MNSISHYRLRTSEKKKRLHEITLSFIQELREVVDLLRDSNKILEVKRREKMIDENTFLIRMKALIKMGLIYCYSIRETFTRVFFTEIEYYDTGMSKEDFDRTFYEFRDLNEKIVKGKYHIYLPKQKYEDIELLRKERGVLVHSDRTAKPIFDMVEYCARIVFEYIQFIEKKMFLKI